LGGPLRASILCQLQHSRGTGSTTATTGRRARRQTSAVAASDDTHGQPLRGCVEELYVAPCTVFVVEDDVDTRDMMGRFLELEGFAVEVAANGKQALERLNAGVHPCVILLDLMMPVMDGWQFRSQQIRDASLASIPVIVVSAAGKERMADIEANAYLSKPVDLEQLLAQVTQYCSTR
jgi:CheY-like chemotaxis protein